MEIIKSSNILNNLIKDKKSDEYLKYLQRFTVNKYFNEVLCNWIIFEKSLFSQGQQSKNIKVEEYIDLKILESVWDFCSNSVISELLYLIKDKYNLNQINNELNYELNNVIFLEIDSFLSVDLKTLNTTNSDFIVSICLNDNDSKITFADNTYIQQECGLLTIQTKLIDSKFHNNDKTSSMLFFFLSCATDNASNV
jgi:hypothetical protein